MWICRHLKIRRLFIWKPYCYFFLGKKEKDLDPRKYRQSCNIFPELKLCCSMRQNFQPVTHCCVSYQDFFAHFHHLIGYGFDTFDLNSLPKSWPSLPENINDKGGGIQRKNTSRDKGKSKGFLLNKNKMIAPYRLSQDLSQSKNT